MLGPKSVDGDELVAVEKSQTQVGQFLRVGRRARIQEVLHIDPFLKCREPTEGAKEDRIDALCISGMVLGDRLGH